MQTTQPVQDIPTLTSDRLILRKWDFKDCDQIDALINNVEIARMTSSVPYPYLPGSAFGFIATQHGKNAYGSAYSFAVTSRETGEILGSSGVFKRSATSRWELGYWIGQPYWGQGYASEAAKTTIDWAAQTLGSENFVAGHFADNPASGKILTKLGFGKVSDTTVPMYSLARGGREPGLMYVWPAHLAADMTLEALH